MAGMGPEGSQFDAKQYDSEMQELLSTGDTDELFPSYDDVSESFDDMGLQENLLRGIYANGTLGVTGETDELFTSYDEVFESFDEMGLQENLLRGIYANEYCDKPSATQQRGAVPSRKELHVIQEEQSGSTTKPRKTKKHRTRRRKRKA